MKKIVLSLLAIISLGAVSAQKLPYQDTSLPMEVRVNDLVSRMTVEEKISQMVHTAPGIERLKVPAYNWWNECLHGIGRSGYKVTVFPQAIGMAASFNPDLLLECADIISTEGRAIFNDEMSKKGFTTQYKGLTFWTPNINIFRDPRWGRGQETYGEDPYLTTVMGKSMVEGIQGTDPKYLKASACAKHYAVHSGPEHNRHSFNVEVSAKDLWETYLPAFESLVKEANVSSVMCAYNRLEGQPCCGSDKLLRSILINDWKFKGYVTSDCWAVRDFYTTHKTHKDGAESSADAVLHGTHLECGNDYPALAEAMKRGLITEEQIDVAVKRLFMIRFRLGMFDPQDDVKYNTIPVTSLEAPAHNAKAKQMSEECMVLLKNAKKTLPFSSKVKKVALVGPNADNGETQLGNYNGHPTVNKTVLMALKEQGVEVVYNRGTDYAVALKEGGPDDKFFSQIKDVDAIIFVGGISPHLEGEAGDAGNDNVEGFAGGDRSSITLPKVQTELLKKLRAYGKPLVFVNMSGSAVAFTWEAENCDAVIQAWYAGQAAGDAIVGLIWGKYNPSGKLPVTFYSSDSQLPDFEDYTMDGRTYRFFDGKPLYPFGYGLSYTSFKYNDLSAPEILKDGENMKVKVLVQNTGKVAGSEVVGLYVSNKQRFEHAPNTSLKAFKKIFLKPGEKQVVEFEITPKEYAYINEFGKQTQSAGNIMINIADAAPTEGFNKNNLTAQIKYE